MTRIIITRHGQTDWNKQGLAQGHTDVPLNKDGIWQAGRLARRLASEKIDVIYSSPLSRAIDTAKIVQRFHPDTVIIVDPDLIEINMGDDEGKNIDYWREEVVYDVPLRPGGESLKEVHERAVRAIDRIVRENPDNAVLVVCHGAVKRMLAMHLRDHTWDEVKDMRFGNTSVSIFTVDGQKKIEELFNCTAHLDDDGIAWKG